MTISSNTGGADDRTDPYRELFERSADAILIIEDERFVDCNAATVAMLRCDSKETVLRTHPSELSPPAQPDGRSSFEKANEMMAIARARGSHRFEWEHLRYDGEVFPVEVLLTAVPRHGKQILHVVWRDITNRKRLEAQLRHAQRMEVIGRLAGGVAHDFNNLLVAILGNGELLLRLLASDSNARGHVDEMLEAGRRAAALVRQLLTFSRRQEAPAAVIDLMPLVHDLRGMLVRLIGEHVTLEVAGPEVALPIRGSRAQLEQVIINLVTNARDAMPRGGTIRIDVRRVALAADTIGAAARLAPGEYALIAVSDTGDGMSEETAARAIEPFFTTKGVGEGTGLGLSMVYGIAEQSGGGLAIDSTPGRGTTVKVFLPLRAGTPTSEAGEGVAGPVAGGVERILVVEDDEAVARVVGQVLTARGYHVQRARHGVEALEMALRDRDHFDLIVTDVVMPRMDGATLVETLRARGVHARVLFMSGYTNNALAVLAGLRQVDLLEKPFTATELATRVRRALDREG